MSLTEEQIALYGRQILVKAVGGRGQEALCAASAHVTGSSIAATYLETGGTPVMVSPFDRLRVNGVESIRRSSKAVQDVVFEENGYPALRTGTDPSTPALPPLRVNGALAVGSQGFCWQVDGCSECHALTSSALTPTEDVEKGALAALAYQRAVLGLGPKQGASGIAVQLCPRHSA